jgi:hypothetical protein
MVAGSFVGPGHEVFFEVFELLGVEVADEDH